MHRPQVQVRSPAAQHPAYLFVASDFDGTELAPMRLAEARTTLGVVAVRQGDIDGAVRTAS
jgi:hypothetical protein